MQRDMDLLREILLGIEVLDNGTGCSESDLIQHLRSKGYEDENEEIYGHCKIMLEAGLIQFTEPVVYFQGRSQIHDFEIGWNGHEFLDDIRNQNVWQKSKETLKEKGMETASIETLKAIISEVIKNIVGL